MFTINADQCGSLRAAIATACRGVATVGMMAMVLSACGGGGGGGGAPNPSNSTPGGGSGNGSGNGSGSGTGGGNNGGGSGNPPPTMTAPVVYLADQDVYQSDELFVTIPGSPGSTMRLSAPLVAGGWVSDFRVVPSGNAVVYTADQNVLGRYELFMVPFSNPGISTRLSAELSTNRDVTDFLVSPDGTKVVYRADMDSDDVLELYIVDVTAPGSAHKLNGPLAASGWVRDNYSFNADGTKVLYRADQDTFDVIELYVVDVAAPGQTYKVNPTLVSGGDVTSEFYFSPDGSLIGYIADQSVDGTLELFVVPTESLGSSTKLSGELVQDGDVCRFKFGPDSQRVAYCADQDTDGLIELYTVAIDAPGASVKLNPPLVAGGRVNSDFQFSSDGSFIIYTAEQDVASLDELYRVEIANPGVSIKVNAPLTPNGDVDSFRLSADDTRVAYVAAQEDPSVWEIFEVDLTEAGIAAKISAPMTAEGVYYFEYAEQDTRVVYLAAQEGAAAQLYDVALSHPGVSTRLNGELLLGGEVWDFKLVP